MPQTNVVWEMNFREQIVQFFSHHARRRTLHPTICFVLFQWTKWYWFSADHGKIKNGVSRINQKHGKLEPFKFLGQIKSRWECGTMAQLQLCHVEKDFKNIDLFLPSLYGFLRFFDCMFRYLPVFKSRITTSKKPIAQDSDSTPSMATVNLQDSRQSAILKGIIPLTVLAVLSVACRFVARKLQKVPLSLDDHMIVVGLVS